MKIRSQSPDTLVLSSRYDAEAEYYFHQKISCCCVAILDDNLDGDILVQWRQKTATTPSLINRVVQTRGIQTGYNKDQVSLASEDQCFELCSVVHLSLLRKLSTALTSLDYERSYDISGKNNIILLRMKEKGHLLLRSKGSYL